MRRIALVIAYDGTLYCGWQIQPNGITIQSAVQDAIAQVVGTHCEVFASGRTDSGVHALGQVVHFDTVSNIPIEKFTKAINTYLLNDIRILRAVEVDSNFHARFLSKSKTYRYTIVESDILMPMDRYSCTLVNGKLNCDIMKKASDLFVGEHDFAGFMSSGSSIIDTIRTVYSCNINKDGNKYHIEISGNGFLYNMVRIIAGAIVECGLGRSTLSELENYIDNAIHTGRYKTMPPQGLTLVRVEYEKYAI